MPGSPEFNQWNAQQADQSMRSAVVGSDNENQRSGTGVAVLLVSALAFLAGLVVGKWL